MKILLSLVLLFTTVNLFAQEKDTELLRALADMDSVKVQSLVKEGASLSSEKVAAFVMLLVQKAAFSDNLETTEKMLSRFEFFVKQGGDVNIRMTTADVKEMTITDTPLTYIIKVKNNCPESLLITIKKLIDLGADVYEKRVTTYKTGPIYQTSIQLNEYNDAMTCYKDIHDILKTSKTYRGDSVR